MEFSLNETIGDFPEDDDEGEGETELNSTLTRTGVYQYGFRDVLVDFPYEAYESQIQMMEKIIDGVNNGENCLLESPTGTGKTAALLCALLAWQKRMKPKTPMNSPIASPMRGNSGACQCGFDKYPGAKVKIAHDKISGQFKVTRCEAYGDSIPASSNGTPQKKQLVLLAPAEERMQAQLCGSCLKKFSEPANQELTPNANDSDPDRFPTIYYATRTHSQIKQVINQLKETSYSRVNMTVLSGRKQSCVNVEALYSNTSVDEHCETLVQNFHRMQSAAARGGEGEQLVLPTCEFYHDKPDRTAEFEKFQLERNMEAWDIEDAVEFGKSCPSCPFYGMKALHEKADIVFCSYNYLLYPYIRNASGVKLENSILVFDEAHNIEQICRDVASISIDEDRMREHVIYQVNKLIGDITVGANAVTTGLVELLNKTFVILCRLSTWIRQKALGIKIGYQDQEQASDLLSIETLSNDLKKLGLGQEEILRYKHEIKLFGERDTSPKLEKSSRQFIEKLVYVLSVIYRDEMQNVADYAYLVIRTKSNKILPSGKPVPRDNDRCELKLMCLNPGLAFRKLRNEARSIIVASGTLSPIISFESELETPFQQQLSAKHVVGLSQVWAGILTRPVSGNLKDLALTAMMQENVEIQDWIGEAILHYCNTVPCGVLVFMPSYKFLNLLRTRWNSYPVGDPLIKKLEATKEVFYEESGASAISFKTLMEEYKKTIVSSSKGCLLFAIFRGKVSEGVDFKDDQARAVITVGIPNLPCKDPSIVAKMEYNRKKNLMPDSKHLSGKEWYDCQAYRAINQAFGRCIRHRNDWGALILLDSRLSWPKNKNKLSKWVQDFLTVYSNPSILNQSLIDFVRNKLHEQQRQQEESGFGEASSNELSGTD